MAGFWYGRRTGIPGSAGAIAAEGAANAGRAVEAAGAGDGCRCRGEGRTARVAALAGASWQTVANGKAELAAEEELPAGRARHPGGGRKPLAEADPGLVTALEELIRDSSRGDPVTPLAWTTRSARHLARRRRRSSRGRGSR
jgi:hypothetical protein